MKKKSDAIHSYVEKTWRLDGHGGGSGEPHTWDKDKSTYELEGGICVKYYYFHIFVPVGIFRHCLMRGCYMPYMVSSNHTSMRTTPG